MVLSNSKRAEKCRKADQMFHGHHYLSQRKDPKGYIFMYLYPYSAKHSALYVENTQ